MNRICLAIIMSCATAALAIINVNFSPRVLVNEADVILVGEVSASGDDFSLRVATAVKSKAGAAQTLSLANCNKDHADDVRKSLKQTGKNPVILFHATTGEEKKAYLHVAGNWLLLAPTGQDKWDVKDFAADMSGTFAGGTDMLIRMATALANDADLDVPVTAGVKWYIDVKLGKLAGETAGVQILDLDGAQVLFVANSEGDKLFRGAKVGEDPKDITAASKLDTKSRRFLWLDLNGDGAPDLVSAGGGGVVVRLAEKGPVLKAGEPASTWKLKGECRGLAACGVDGKPGVLVSGEDGPTLIQWDGKGWKQLELPGAAESSGGASACIVADFDNDGFADIIQPGEASGRIWKGKAGGFAAPVKCGVSAGSGPTVAALGDFNQDGFLDVFLSGKEQNGLWENDGKGDFANVFGRAGSMSYKCRPNAADVKAIDLNHDGRGDVCLVYKGSDLVYHWNRGFRSFGEEGEVRLGQAPEAGTPPAGHIAIAAGDLDGNGSEDLAAVSGTGELAVFYNDKDSLPGVKLRLPKGMAGPVTASVWTSGVYPNCLGAAAAGSAGTSSYISTRYPGPVKVKFTLPGKPPQAQDVKIEDSPKDVTLGG